MARTKSVDEAGDGNTRKPSIDDAIYPRGENYYPTIMYRASGAMTTVYNETEEQFALDEGWKWHVKALHGEDKPE